VCGYADLDVTSRPRRAQQEVEMTIEQQHLPIGWTTSGEPVWAARGAAGGIQIAVGDDDGTPDDDLFDDDEDGDEPDEDDDEDEAPAARKRRRQRDDEDDDGDTDWTPPTREAFRRMEEALKKANGEAGKRRRFGKLMDRLGIDDPEAWLTQRGINPEDGLPYGDDVVDPRDDVDEDFQEDDRRRDRNRDREIARAVRTAEQRGRNTTRDELMPVIMELTARDQLREAGFSGTKAQMARMLRSIDPNDLDVEVDSDGFELVGMDDEIERLREEFPQLFGDAEEEPRRRRTGRAAPGGNRTTATRTRGARDVDGGNRGRQPAAPRGWAAQAVDQLMNGQR
jgi:hypothetical protein